MVFFVAPNYNGGMRLSSILQKKDRAQAILDDAVAHQEMAGVACSILLHGETVFSLSSGYANLEEKRPVKRDDIYHLFSMTKPITALAALLLIQDGRLSLTDPIERYLPTFAHPQVETKDGIVPSPRSVTVQDLLNMAGGLCYSWGESQNAQNVIALYKEMSERRRNGDKPMTTVEFASRVGQAPLAYAPGTSWAYSVSADVLGAVIEVASGQSFGSFLKQRIFTPLGMDETGFFVPAEKRFRLTQPYFTKDGDLVPFREESLGIAPNGEATGFESGGAGLYSTLPNMERLAQCLLRGGKDPQGNSVFQENTLRFFFAVQPMQPSVYQAFHHDCPGIPMGCHYSNFLRLMAKPQTPEDIPGECYCDGWQGAYLSVFTKDDLAIVALMGQCGHGTGPVNLKLKKLIFGSH